MSLRAFVVLGSVPFFAVAAEGSLLTHALVSYGAGAPNGQEVYSTVAAAAQAGYSGAGWFAGEAEAHAAYGVVGGRARVEAQNAMYPLQVAVAEGAFSDELRISGGVGAGFVVYTYSLSGFATGEADAHIFLRHEGDPDEELAEEATSGGDYESLPHAITFGEPFRTGISILVAASVGEGESGEALGDFSVGAALTGIRVFDGQMRPIAGWTIESQSGTSYPVPASGTGVVVVLAAGAARRRRRRFGARGE